MNFERRDFLRVTTAGVAGTLISLQSGFTQDAPQPKVPGGATSNQNVSQRRAQFKGGSGSLQLDLKLSTGTLHVQADNYSRGRDAGAFASGTFKTSQGDDIGIYRSYFCVDGAKQVFCRLGDSDHWTSLVLAITDDPDILSLTLWQDGGAPDGFRISKKAFLQVATGSGRPDPTKFVLDDRGPALKPDGNRKPPNIDVEEFINAIDDNREFLAFVRGKRLSHQHATHTVFACFFYARVFNDVILSSIWEGFES